MSFHPELTSAHPVAPWPMSSNGKGAAHLFREFKGVWGFVFVLALLFPLLATAEGDGFASKSVGHNLSSNNHLLDPHQVSLGTLYCGVGVTENWSVGTSPFAITSFGMINGLSRWAWNISETERLGFEASYYKTFRDKTEREKQLDSCSACTMNGFTSFEMEAWVSKFTYSRNFLNNYRFSWTQSIYYYVNDERPFSLRMDPQNDNRYAFNSTTLNEFQLSKNTFLNLEAGFWGMNYTYPYVHLGASFDFQSDNLLFGIGASTTISPGFPEEKIKYFAGYDSRASLHPEVQMQLFF